MFIQSVGSETDLFGNPFIQGKNKKAKVVKRTGNYRDVIKRKAQALSEKVNSVDLFGDDELAEMYISGVSSISDLKGCIKSNKSICVNKVDMSKPATSVLIEYLNRPVGGLVFIDSGAFRVIGKDNHALNFDDVFKYYFSVIDNIKHKERLTVCAPDVIGDQIATIDLQLKYEKEINRLISLGVKVMFPLQRGGKSLSEVYCQLCCLFGGENNVVVGLPSNAKAIPVDEFMEFLNEKPKRVHLLGVKNDRKIVIMGVHKSPETHFSCDSNRPKAYIGVGEPITELSKEFKFEANELFTEILDNCRGEVYVTDKNKWVVETLDVELDYTEFNAEDAIRAYDEEDIQSLCKLLKHHFDELTPAILIDAVSQGTFLDFVSELYTFEFACLLHDEVWEHYRTVKSKDLTAKKASPKARTHAIHTCCEMGLFE